MSDLSVPSRCPPIKAVESRKCLGTPTSFKGRGKAGGPYLTDKEKQISRYLCSSWQGTGYHLHCPSIYRKSEQTWPWEGQHGDSDRGSTTSWKTSNMRRSLSGPWSLHPSNGDEDFDTSLFLQGHVCSWMQYFVKHKITLCSQMMVSFQALPSID